MKLRLAGTVNRLNVEHRILMTLRFNYFKTSEPQPATNPSILSSGSKDLAVSNHEGWNRCSLSFELKIDRIPSINSQPGQAGTIQVSKS